MNKRHKNTYSILCAVFAATLITACSKPKLLSERELASSGSGSGSTLSIVAASPSTADTGGGTTLTITGTGFANGATVSIDGASCVSVTYVSSTQLNCVLPPGAVGAASITVTNPDGRITSNGTLFSYINVPDPVAGVVFSTAGGIQSGAGIKVHATVGEESGSAGTGNIQSAAGITVYSGFSGAMD